MTVSQNTDHKTHPRPKPKISRPRGLPGWALGVIYLVLTVGPVIAAISLGGGARHGQNLAPLIGRALGILAMAMLLLQFLTSGRFEQISGRIGLDRTMGFHRVAAGALLLVIVGHIAGFMFRAQSWAPDVLLARLAAMITSTGLLGGTLAAGILLLLVLWAKYLRHQMARYEIWRLLHGGLAVAAMVLALRHSFVHARLFADPLGTGTIIVLAVIALGSIGIIYVWRLYQGRAQGFVVDAVHTRAPGIAELILRGPKDGAFRFTAGQFAWLTLGRRHSVTDNPFSILSLPSELPRLRFMIRDAGDMTHTVPALVPGTPVAIDGPHGSFTLQKVDISKPVLLIAGGIGIVPVLGVLAQLAEYRITSPVYLLLAVRDGAELRLLRDQLPGLQENLDLRALCLFEHGEGDVPTNIENITVQKARYDQTHLVRLLDGQDAAEMVAFVCGPPVMMDAAIDDLAVMGVLDANIRMERFDYDAANDIISRRQRQHFTLILMAGVVITVLATILSVWM